MSYGGQSSTGKIPSAEELSNYVTVGVPYKTDGSIETGLGSTASSFPEYLAGELPVEEKSRAAVLEARRGSYTRDSLRIKQPRRRTS